MDIETVLAAVSALEDIVVQTIKSSNKFDNQYNGAPGEVSCEICVDKELKAVNSCLMCLASYCSTNLQKHGAARLKGHKLVEPGENLDERACLQRGRPWSCTAERGSDAFVSAVWRKPLKLLFLLRMNAKTRR